MNNFRKLAISAGILFIIYTSLDVLSFLFLGPVNSTNYLVSVSENASLVGAGAFLLIIGGVCASGIAISLYPALKKSDPVLALGAVGFRISERVLRFVSVCILLSIISLSQLYVKAGAPESSYFQILGELLLAARGWVSHVGALLAFSIGCTLYYIAFYRTNLIPRWISIWGLVFGISGMISCALVGIGLIAPMGTEQVLMIIPMLPQEIVLAVWLIVKGFNPSVIVAHSR